ncbi:ATP-binding protein [Thermopolyspora sp. NPDC052614]|uniref:ATP-binding protein n=1 Tax=Thermopolyspora sp. NPDC052614 TaxID=3155682 RepID=UPI00343DDE2C
MLLERRLNAARDRLFKGRSSELALFRSALVGDPTGSGPTAPFAVLYVYGPGGIGKSALLRRFAEEARASGRRVVQIDARVLDASPAAFESAVGDLTPDPATGGRGAVVLVDTFERLRRLETWLRERYLPRLPTGVLVVLASRHTPEAGWCADPGWAEALRVMPLRNLSPDDATALLDARGVPARLHRQLLAFTGGHPLALNLAAELAAQDDGDMLSWTPTQNVVERLLPRLVGDVPSPSHRYALEVCAHVRTTTEELLRAVGVDDPAAMFEWLRGLPFVESGRHGLYPHDVVREALDADLRWRDPQGYELMHRRIRAHLVARAKAARGQAVLPAMGALNYLRRYGRIPFPFQDSGREDEMFEDHPRPGDIPAMLALAARTKWAPLRPALEFWLERRIDAFTVLRRVGADEPVAFLLWLTLDTPDETENAVDPVVAAAWAHCRATGGLRPGERLNVGHFLVYGSEYRPPSPVQDLFQQRLMANAVAAERVALTYVVTAVPEFWQPLMRYFDHELAVTAPVDGIGYGLFAHDWRTIPLAEWLDRMESWELFGGHGRAATPAPELAVLSRPEFDTAVRQALRHWRDRTALADNPLTRSRVVRHGGDGDAVKLLRDLLVEAVDTLSDDPRTAKLHRALTTTYFHRVPTQEAAAERLSLPYSTYRRHLHQGVTRVCDLLWHREMHGLPAS